MRLLVTRPGPEAQRTAAELRARGHAVVVEPLMSVEVLPGIELGPAPWSAVLITSANAVHAVLNHRHAAELKSLPLFAVGARSAGAARAAGFADVASADGNVTDLARLIRARVPANARLLYLSGEDRSGDLGRELATFDVRTVAVYRAVAAARLPRAAHDAVATGDLGGVLHYSRRSAAAYVSAARAAVLLERALAPWHYCLSAQVAEPLAAAGAKTIRIAVQPDEPSLLALIGAA